MTQTEPPPLLKFREAMDYLRVSRSTLYRFIWSGQLTSHKVGSTMRFYKADLDKCIEWKPMPRPDRKTPDTITDAVHQHI